eukprot:12542361-Alexandrium_andersonii.AAC.1
MKCHACRWWKVNAKHAFCHSCSDDWLAGWQDTRARAHLWPWPGRGYLGKMTRNAERISETC